MRWYFGIDRRGSEGEAGVHAKLAVISAQMVGGLEPRLLHSGATEAFTGWMRDHGVTVIEAEPPCFDAMRAAAREGRFRGHTIGHWLRLAIPHIDRDADYALYTDTDVVFRRRPDFSALTSSVFAAAPEFDPDVWNYFNSGVMLMNMRAMRATAPALEALLRANMEAAAGDDDQTLLNHAYRGHWRRLDPRFNWKPYWPMREDAVILHFHGPKLPVIEAIVEGRWHAEDTTARALTAMLHGHLSYYAAWLADLGDLLQLADPAAALRLQSAAAALARHTAHAVPPPDLSFMQFRMFPE